MGCCNSAPIFDHSEETLSFPVGFSGVFEFLRKLTFPQFLSQVEATSFSGHHWRTFLSTSSTFLAYFDINDSFEFHFSNLQFEIISFQFRSDLQEWMIEGSNNRRNWTTLHRGRNGGGMQQLAFEPVNFGCFNNLRIINCSSFKSKIKSFEIFGSIHLKDSSLNLSKLTKASKVQLNISTIYSFSFNERFGFMSFLLMLSAKDAIENFDIYESSSSINSTIFNLLKNDKSCWISKNHPNTFLSINFHFRWKFHITGFLFKNGMSEFPRSWTLFGKKYHNDMSRISLAEFHNDQSLQSPFQDQAFQVDSNEYFEGFIFQQTGLNSNESNIFCLSQIEIYGELKYF
jgi:hypothetical protein